MEFAAGCASPRSFFHGACYMIRYIYRHIHMSMCMYISTYMCVYYAAANMDCKDAKPQQYKHRHMAKLVRRRMCITAVIAEWNSKPADPTIMMYRCGAHLRAYMHASWNSPHDVHHRGHCFMGPATGYTLYVTSVDVYICLCVCI